MNQWIKYVSAMILCMMLCLIGPGIEIALAQVASKDLVLDQAAPEDPVVSLEGLRVEILWGDNSPVRIGRDVPITVRLTSTGAEVTGTARAMVPTGNGEYYVLEETVSVASG